jgi:hypothetical protein
VIKWLDKVEGEAKKKLAADVFIGLLEAAYLQDNWKSVIGKADAFEGLIKNSRCPRARKRRLSRV